jgi:hypothetical protein
MPPVVFAFNADRLYTACCRLCVFFSGVKCVVPRLIIKQANNTNHQLKLNKMEAMININNEVKPLVRFFSFLNNLFVSRKKVEVNFIPAELSEEELREERMLRHERRRSGSYASTAHNPWM